MINIYWTKPNGFFNVEKGFVVLRENLWTKKYKTGGYKINLYDSEVFLLPDDLAIAGFTCSNGVYTGTIDLTKVDLKVLDALLKLKRHDVKDHSNANIISPSVLSKLYHARIENQEAIIDDLKNNYNYLESVDITIPTQTTIKRRKLEARTGLKIRWMPQRILKLPINSFQIDTDNYKMEDSESIPLTVDVDYKIRIVDPEVFGEKFSPFYKSFGSEGFKEMIKNLSTDLEKIFLPYIRSHKYKELTNFELVQLELYNLYSNKMKKIEDEYGIEITNLYVRKVEPPESIKKAEEKKKTAEAEAEAMKTKGAAEAEVSKAKGQAEADVTKMRGKAEAAAMRAKGQAKNELLQQSVDIMNQSSDPNSVALLNNNGTNIIIGGNSNNNNPAVAGVVASQVTQAQQQTQQTSSNNNNGGITVDALRNALISNGKTEDEINQILATLGLGNNNQNSNENSNQGPSMHQ